MPTLSRATTSGLLAALLLLLLAPGANADPAVPTNYRSVVTDGVPEGLQARVSGGDAFLVLEVPRGTEVQVPGYEEEEQFLRWLPDGRVEVNTNSQAFYVSEERYGTVAPPGAGPEAEPAWEQVSSDGTFAWHDHRIHWMSPALPQQVDPGAGDEQEVFTWAVPMVVDGTEVAVEGHLAWVPDTTPVLPAVALVVVGALAVLAVRRGLVPTAAVAAAVGGGTAAVLLLAEQGLATGAEVALPPLVAPVVGALAPLAAAFVPGRPDNQRRGLVVLGGAALAAVGVLGVPWLTAPELPVDLAAPLVRAVFAACLGAGLGLVSLLVMPVGDADGAASAG